LEEDSAIFLLLGWIAAITERAEQCALFTLSQFIVLKLGGKVGECFAGPYRSGEFNNALQIAWQVLQVFLWQTSTQDLTCHL
jgi:hypothetical protein